VAGRVASGFGKRIDPISSEGAFHNGLDIELGGRGRIDAGQHLK
jgi:murein DD-endopeptidase MepM/ murein hydrolase activator NlpD